MAKRAKVLVLIMAGGEGGRMGVLTQRRSKPALPFGGVYRLIDFALSNCAHSKMTDVWVIEQYQPHGLADHLANGRPWELDRTTGGLLILHPHQGGSGSGWHQGTADAVWRNREFIREFGPDVVMALSSDHLYTLDYRELITAHTESGATVTMGTTEVDEDEASRFGVVEAEGDRVTGYAYKPEEPATTTATTEVFAFDTGALLDTLDDLVEGDGADQGEDSELEDFGTKLLPRLVDQGGARALAQDGYWRDLGTPDSYFEGHRDLLEGRLDLGDPGWPIMTRALTHPPAAVTRSAEVHDSLLSSGCTVRGRVERSVLSPGVVVEEGAVVEDAILLPGAFVAGGAVVRRAIVDSQAKIEADTEVGGDGPLTLIGMRAVVRTGQRVTPGESVDARGI